MHTCIPLLRTSPKQYIQTCIQRHISTNIHTYIHTYIHTFIHTLHTRIHAFIRKALRAWRKSLAQLRMHSRLMHQTFAWNSATCRQEMLTISIYCLSIQARNPAKAKPEVPSKEPKWRLPRRRLSGRGIGKRDPATPHLIL